MNFNLARVVAPTDTVLTMAEARMQLRVDTFGSPPASYEDDLIAAAMRTATEELDAGTGWLGRAIAPQTWRLSLNSLPGGSCGIRLPYPPFIEVVSFTYTDNDGTVQTLTEGTDFRVLDFGDLAVIRPLYGATWPIGRTDYDAVNITFRCGYVTGSPEVFTPLELVKNFVKSRMTELYDNRGVHDNANTKRGELTQAVVNSLNNIRVYGPYIP